MSSATDVFVMKAIVNDDTETDPVPYLTGGIYTKFLKEFKPGRIEVRAKIKGVQGSQPAIWTGALGRNDLALGR